MRHNKHVTATRPLQRNFAAAFRITPNAGCVPGTGAVRILSGAGQGSIGRMERHRTAREVRRRKRQKSGGKSHGNSAGAAGAAERTTAGTAVGAEREQCKTSRNSRKNNARNSSGARREQRRKQQQGERKKANYSEKSGAALTIRKQHSQKILIIRPLSNRNQIHKSGNK